MRQKYSKKTELNVVNQDDSIKVSVITVCFNSEKTIERTIQSVAIQDYPNKEHIIIDGNSSDGTLSIIKKHSKSLLYVSEKDDGLYDAMNKGIRLATGKLIVFLNSDDWYDHNGALRSMIEPFEQNRKLDIGLFGISFVRPQNLLKPYRRIKANGFMRFFLLLGVMPPHPGMVVSKDAFTTVGYFNQNYKICGDYEWCLRAFLKHKTTYLSFEEEVVTMLYGGLSTQGLKSYLAVSKEVSRALYKNGFALFIPVIWFRAIFKAKQFWT